MFDELYRAGRVELDVVPQGTLAEQMRAAGAGIGAFYKETREIDGRAHVLEHPIKGDVALISAHRADTMGNLAYRKTARNFGPVMATVATTVVAQVTDIVPVGDIAPETVVTPGIYVDRLVRAEARRLTVQGAR